MVTFDDLLSNIADNTQNFDTTTIDKGNIMRQANRAIEYYQRRLGLPSDEKTFSFFYYQDVPFYDCPIGFNEFIQLYYNTDNKAIANPNKPRNRWNSTKTNDMNNWSSGYQMTNKVGTTYINGKTQLQLLGHNLMGEQMVNAFDTTSGLTYSADISNVTIDTTDFVQGSGSLRFDTSDITDKSIITMTGTWNIQQLFKANAAFRLNVEFPDDNLPTESIEQFSSVEIRFQSSVGNYYSIVTTVQANGADWTFGEWNLLGWLLPDAATYGNPDSTNITEIDIIFNHSALYIGVANVRIDNFYNINPDYLTCEYYSAFKGTDSTGMTPKINLDGGTDICSFGDYAQDLIEPIALRATVKLFPQLRGDKDFYAMYKAESEDAMRVWGRVYPHKRSMGNFGQTEVLR